MLQSLWLTGIPLVLLSGMAEGGETVSPSSLADTAPTAQDREAKPPIACQLSPGKYGRRIEDIEDLFSSHTEIRELDDGYAFQFPGDADWAAKLLDFINAERECCQFFTFDLSFEPNQGPIWLRVRGSTEIKAFLDFIMRK